MNACALCLRELPGRELAFEQKPPPWLWGSPPRLVCRDADACREQMRELAQREPARLLSGRRIEAWGDSEDGSCMVVKISDGIEVRVWSRPFQVGWEDCDSETEWLVEIP